MFDLIFFVLEELGAAGGKAATTKNSLSSLDMFDVRCSSFFSFFGTLGQGLTQQAGVLSVVTHHGYYESYLGTHRNLYLHFNVP